MLNLLQSLFYLIIKGTIKIERDCCPSCGSTQIINNGKIHNRKDKYECKKCNYQFVKNPSKRIVTQQEKDLIDKLLLERISLRGIARLVDISWRWLQNYVNNKFSQIPQQVKVLEKPRGKLVIECDEMWSFVNSKNNEYWVWLAIDKSTREIVGCFVGDRSRKSAEKLWQSLPTVYRESAVAYTDFWEAYKTVIPLSRHRPVPKSSGQTNHVERLNSTFRQRISRLVHKSLSFSKKLNNHIGAIWYFTHHYNDQIANS